MITDPSEFTLLGYITTNGYKPGDKLPTIQQIASDCGISIAKVREALEVARALGLVEVRPGRGTHVAPLQIAEAVKLATTYAIGVDEDQFAALRELRNGLETQFWDEATRLLTADDISYLRNLISQAVKSLEGSPVQIPAREHRDFHLTIFSHLENLFVTGILDAFWDAYETFGYSLYQDLSYHQIVWSFHAKMVDAIEAGDSAKGKDLLIQHMALMTSRIPTSAKPPRNPHINIFE